MIFRKRLHALLLTFCLLPALLTASAQHKSGQDDARPAGAPVLWRAPEDIPSRDLYLGPGGERMRPDLSRVTFVKDETGGYSTKFRVRDGAGREWVAKVGKEAQSETAAVRLVWAVGHTSHSPVSTWEVS